MGSLRVRQVRGSGAHRFASCLLGGSPSRRLGDSGISLPWPHFEVRAGHPTVAAGRTAKILFAATTKNLQLERRNTRPVVRTPAHHCVVEESNPKRLTHCRQMDTLHESRGETEGDRQVLLLLCYRGQHL